MNRKLVLKREVLSQIDANSLTGVVGGAPPTANGCANTDRVCVNPETLYSCYTFVSCHIVDCLVDRVTPAIAPTVPC